MSNKENDQIIDKARDIVDEMMARNPTIPVEARKTLLDEILQDLISKDMQETIDEEGAEHYE